MSARLNLSGENSPYSKEGMNVFAYKWSVDRKVDLSPVKASYLQKWTSLECAALEVLPLAGENAEGYQQRMNSFHRFVTLLNTAGSSWRDIRRIVIDILKVPGVRIDLVRYHEHISRTPSSRKFYATVIMSTLLHLYENNEVELAHSIWQSLRADAVSRDEDLPDQVGEWIKTDSRVREDPGSLLQLDPNRDGSFNQIWLFERIMTDGFVWVGQYQCLNMPSVESHRRKVQKGKQHSPGNNSTSTQGHEPVQSRSGRSILADILHNCLQTRFDVLDHNGELVDLFRRDGTSEPHPEPKGDQHRTKDETGRLQLRSRSHHSPAPQSILQQQQTKSLLQIALIQQFMKRGDSHRLGNGPASAVANIIAYCITRGTGIWSPEVERHRASQVACFDVDEPCLVFTPYDTAREMLPHPTTRSMKICWVARSLSADRDIGAAVIMSDGEAASRAHGNALSEGSECIKSKEQEAGDIVQGEEYKVVKMVKGMWRIMEIPKQKYMFR